MPTVIALISVLIGGLFSKISIIVLLHQPLPSLSLKPTTGCPRGKPVEERTLHYGNPAPGFTDSSQAPLPWPIRSPLPTPTHEVVPEPLPTQEGPVAIPAPGAMDDAMPTQAQSVK